MDQQGFTFPAQISIRPLSMGQMLRAPQRDRHEPSRTFPPSACDEDIRVKTVRSSPAYSSTYMYQHRRQTAPYPRSTPSPSIETRQSGSYAHTRTSPRENYSHIDDRDDFTSTPSRPSSTLNTGKASYNIIKPLGEPSDINAGTYLIEDRLTEDLFVEKRLPLTTPFARERATAERNALFQIDGAGNSNNNIIKIYDSFYDGMADYSSLVLEHCDYGTLQDFIDRYIRERKQCPEAFAWRVLESISAALCICHHGIRDPAVPMSRLPEWNTLCHLDIRPENIFLTSSHQQGFYPRIVLGNFACVATPESCDSGLAEIVVVHQSGDSRWLPPEITPSSSPRPVQGRSTDIW
ncbi:hypothetical protein DOTSEDRAFT_19831 [Lecanosticta acicola]|uniref:non-specific serine/threonine protein kinase n=1 Tax=Lecanosticta acicola TaxID=111012 RepID=A0AAI9E8P8_9PEZI|nr:hypothetical protein DOTSEDRAFT_19831 [Lecanosticta acicola]